MSNYNEHIDKQEYDLALKEIDFHLEGDPYSITLLTVKAQVLTKLEQYLKAIAIYNSLINLLPDQALNYADRGLCYHFMSQTSESLADFSKAIDLEPENPYRYASRAFIRDAQGDSLGALADYEIAIKLDPEDAVSMNNKGIIEEKLGRAKDSDRSLSQADKVSGIAFDIDEFEKKKIASKKPAKPKIGLRYYYSTLKALLNSANERKKFYKFISKR